MPGQGKDGCLLKGYALDDDDDDLSESTPAAPPSSSAFSWIWRRSRPGDTSAATNNKQGSTEQSSSSVPSSGHHGSLLSHSYSMPAMPHSSASPPPPIGAYCSNPALGPGHMLEGLQAPSQKVTGSSMWSPLLSLLHEPISSRAPPEPLQLLFSSAAVPSMI